jgi:ribonuclease HI
MADLPVLTIHTDGASRGNPGAAAFGYVLYLDDGSCIEEAGCLGLMTNNQAEYTALIRALEHALELGADHDLLIHSDSELMVKQLNGLYRVKNPDLQGLYQQAKHLIASFHGNVKVRHVRRGQNGRADALCNEALDGKFVSTRNLEEEITAFRKHTETVKEPSKTKKQSLREAALAQLRQAKENWGAGGQAPSPEHLWKQLETLLRDHGVVIPGSR